MPLDVAGLIPHQGAMCLLDSVEDWSQDRIVCLATSHRRSGHPLRDNRGLRALCAIEYGAQAIAAHAGLLGRSAGSRPGIGYLAALRDVVISLESLDGIEAPLRIDAQVVLRQGNGHIYEIAVTAGARTIMTGRLSVMVPREAEQAGPSPVSVQRPS